MADTDSDGDGVPDCLEPAPPGPPETTGDEMVNRVALRNFINMLCGIGSASMMLVSLVGLVAMKLGINRRRR